MGVAIDVGDPDEFDDESDDGSDTLYLRYCFEGASSLAELARAMRGLAVELEQRAAEGWRMDGPVEGGWAHLMRAEQP